MSKMELPIKKSRFTAKSRFKESKCVEGGHSLNRASTVLTVRRCLPSRRNTRRTPSRRPSREEGQFHADRGSGARCRKSVGSDFLRRILPSNRKMQAAAASRITIEGHSCFFRGVSITMQCLVGYRRNSNWTRGINFSENCGCLEVTKPRNVFFFLEANVCR